MEKKIRTLPHILVKYGNICYTIYIVLPPIVPKCEESSYHNDPLFIHDIAAVFHAIKVRYFMDIFTYSHLGQKTICNI